MENARGIVCTPKRAEGRAWASLLGAVGSTVSLVETPAEIQPEADLILAHIVDDNGPATYQALGRLPPGATAVVVLPQPGLPTMVDALGVSTVRAVLVEGYVDSRLLTYVSAKALWGDIFGVAKVLPWGVRVHSAVVNTHEGRAAALLSMTHFAKALGLRDKYVDAIKLVLDELLMNALYNAPVGKDGRSLYRGVAAAERAGLKLKRPVILQAACDGTHFAASVRDSYGSLRRSTIVEYLLRCVRAKGEQIERKASGAGLGLYLAASSVTEFIANLLPGFATEIVCVFDLHAPRQQLRHLGIYEETKGAGQPQRVQPQPGTARRISRPATSRMVTVTLVTAVLLLMVATFLLVLPSLRRSAKSSLGVEPGSVEPGSAVHVDGAVRGDQVRLAQRQQKARVRVESTPPGANISLDGKPTGQVTPASVEGLEPGRTYQLRLDLKGRKEATGTITPSAEKTLLWQTELPVASDVAEVWLESNPPGARLLVNDVDTGLVTPVKGHTLRAGRYRLRLALAGRAPWKQEVVLKAGGVVRQVADLPEAGLLSVHSTVPLRASIDGVLSQPTPVDGRPVPAGTRTLRLRSDTPLVDLAFEISFKAGVTVTRRLLFGFVVTNRPSLKIKVGKRMSTRAAFLPGRHEIKLVDTKADQTRTEPVEVVAGTTIALE